MQFVLRFPIFLALVITGLTNNCGQKVEEKAGASADSTLPIASIDEATINTGETVTLDVSLNDTDPGDNLDPQSVVLGVSVGGSCEFDTEAPFVKFTPLAGFRGNGSCGYTICDDSANCTQSVFSVTVMDTTPPTANTDFASTNMNSTSNPIDTSVNDSDEEGPLDDTSLVTLTTPASVGGSCSVSPYSPFIKFTPTSSFAGNGSCAYRVCDTADPSVTTDVLANDLDPEDSLDVSSLTVQFAVGGSCVVTSGQIQFTPNSGFTGQASCGYRVCDVASNCSNSTLNINVGDGTVPIVNDDAATTESGVSTGFINVAADTIVTFSIPDDPTATSITLNGAPVLERSFKIQANGFVMATSYMNSKGGQGKFDDMPFLPKGRKLLGVPSRAGFLGTGSETPVNLTIYHSDGTVQLNKINNSCVDTGEPLSLVAGSALSIMPFRFELCRTSQSNWELYKPEVVYVDADQDVAGNNVADANGGNAAPFVPISLMKKRYIIPVRTAYLVFASTRPAVINQIDSNGTVVATHTLVRTGDGPNDDGTFHPLTPYRIRLGSVEPGTRFEGVGPTDLSVGWYQGASTDPLGNSNGYSKDDETVLYGY